MQRLPQQIEILEGYYGHIVSAYRMSSNVPPTQTLAVAPLCTTLNAKEKGHIDHGQFPEGGGAAWCTVFGGALVMFCTLGYMSSFGVYQEFYTLDYLTNESASTISWIGSTNAFMLNSFGLVSGILYDRGYFYHLLIGGSMLQSFALFMLSLARPGQYYQVLLAQGIGLGLGQGMVYVPVLAVVSHYFRQRRTLGMSLVAAGSSVGAIVHPIMLNYLFNRGVGFANGVRISAAFITLLLLLACLLIRTRLGPSVHPTSYLSVGRGIIHDVPFFIMNVGIMFFQMGFYFPLFYWELDSIQHGNSETFSFYSLVILNGTGLIGRLSAGFIAPRVGLPKLVIISTATCGILIFCMIGLSNIPTVVIIGTIYGYSAGVYIALLAPLMTLLTSDFSELGARMGIGMTVAGIGGLLGGPISGALLTFQYKWWQPSLFSGTVALFGCSLLILMQSMLTHREYSVEQPAAEREA